MGVAGNVAVAGALSADNLKCEYHKYPLGIDAMAPRLSWILESRVRSQKQTAYQVLVASSESLLRQDKGDLWDTGRVESDQNNQISYTGSQLVSEQRCFWKVRVWDKDGKVSAWSKSSGWTMGLLQPGDWKAKWIGVAKVDKDSMPCFRKSFNINKLVKRATVYVTAAGLYELHINGERVSKDYFTPGWTEYSKRIYYFTYDVTNLLQSNHENVIGVMMGDGWYGLHHGGRKKLALLAQLHIEYADGSSDVIETDNSWKTTLNGPILMTDIYNGESYDARRDMNGWDKPGYGDYTWKSASTDVDKPVNQWMDVTDRVRGAVSGNSLSIAATNDLGGDPLYGTIKSLVVKYSLDGVEATKVAGENQTLAIDGGSKRLVIIEARYGSTMQSTGFRNAVIQAYPGVPVRKTQEIKVVKITQPKHSVFVYDLGQNFSGWVRLKADGPAGKTVTLRFAEMLNPDGTIYTTNLRSAKCTDTYTLKGGESETWEPRFTFHGFRYVEVTGYPGKPSKNALIGIVMHSNAGLTSTFECSNPMLNQLQHNIVWGQRSNYFEVPTDCPQRDERMGWSGDAQVFIGTAAYNMDITAFFTSWMNTFNDSQDEAGGYPNVAPKNYGVSPAWGDAGIICPWVLYQRYGDTSIIRQHWDGMTKWIAYLEEHSKGYLRPDEGFGDWLNIDAEMPREVISTAYFAYSTHLMSKMALIIGKPDEAAKYEKLFVNIKEAFNKTFVTDDGLIWGNTQTTYLMALKFDLLPENKRQMAADRLIKLIEQRNWHISIGFLGVNLLLPVLTDAGRLDVAYKLLQNEDFPSWGYPVKHGATTIWERWDGWTEDKGFQDPGMNSFNHYSYGSCGEWMLSSMAGISTDGPGFKRIVIHPRPGGGISYTKASYDSIEGLIASSWKQSRSGFALDVTIPANTTATVYVPAKNIDDITESGRPTVNTGGLSFLRMENGCAVFDAGSGEYKFRVK